MDGQAPKTPEAKQSVFSRIKDNFSKPTDNIDAPPHQGDDASNDISFDSERLKEITTKYWWAILLIIPLVLSTFLRMQPTYLPITDDWARDSVYNSIRSQMTAQVQQQYPNLPPSQINSVVADEFNKFLEQNSQGLDAQIKQISAQFKSQLQDASGQTYLIAIDPYLWLGQAENYELTGHQGTEYVNGESWHGLRNGRQGLPATFSMMSFLTYLVSSITSWSAMASQFILPVLLLGLAVLLAFFIGRRTSDNIGGFIAASILAIHAALLGRTAAGFADTDNLITVFEMLTVFLFVLTVYADTAKKRLTYSIATGVAFGLYIISHPSWWHMLDIVIGASIVYIIGKLALNIYHKRAILGNGVKSALGIPVVIWIFTVITGAIFSAMAGGSATISAIIRTPVKDPLKFITLKEVGLSKIWPNVFTTVAELNTSSLDQVISGLGGPLLFYLSVAGLLYFAYESIAKQNAKQLAIAALLIAWMLASVYAAQSSLRFIAFVVPVFAFGLGLLTSALANGASKLAKSIHLNSKVSKIGMCIVMIFLLLPLWTSAQATAKNEVPSMNDAWYTALTKIKDASDDAIITSWWDFGHWFVAIARRKVTFDGGDQGRRIHWVGNSLLESDEETAVGILRMLNCNQDEAVVVLQSILGENVAGQRAAVRLLYDILDKPRDQALTVLKEYDLTEDQANTVLSHTHCQDLLDHYFITSEDMVGKAGVWGHFGSWNFTRAGMFNEVRGKTSTQGERILQDTYGLDETTAKQYYQEIQTRDGDQWISPWPGYLSGVSACAMSANSTLVCPQNIRGQQIPFVINLDTRQARIGDTDNVPNTLVIPTEQSTVEIKQNGTPAGISLVLIPSGSGYSSIVTAPEQANSMFTRLFFMEGHGLKHFKKFDDRRGVTGGRIITWVIDYSSEELNIHPDRVIKTEVSPGDTVFASYIGAFENGTLFDSSISNWQQLGVRLTSDFDDYQSNPFSFTAGSGQVIPGFDAAVLGANKGDIIETTIPPAEGYGLDPTVHPLGNKTLVFKIRIEDIK